MATTKRARFFVEGVSAAVSADLVNERDDSLVVAQALPFLRLDTPIRDEQGRKGHIRRIALSMECDVPSLIIELSRDEVSDEPEPPAVSIVPGVSLAPPRPDATTPYALREASSPPRQLVVGAKEPTFVPPPGRRSLLERFVSWLGQLAASLGLRIRPALPS